MVNAYFSPLCTPYYDNQYNPRVTLSSTDIKDVIMHPNMFNLSSGNGSLELWSKGNTAIDINNNIVYKTLYDPTPIGYSLPKSNAFTGFTSSNINGTFNKGYNFYCNSNNKGITIFIPALGFLLNTSGLIYTIYDADYWTIGPTSSYSGVEIGFNSNVLYTIYSNPRNYGFTILPSLE